MRGLLFRSDTVVPFGRVQHIDVHQGPLERAYGLGTLVLHTAGTHNASVSLPGLAHGDALAMREDIRARVREGLKSLSGKSVIQDAPDEFVLLRVVATRQSCDDVKGDPLPALDPAQLVGCAYSCPTLFDRADEVFLGFETLTASCEQGVRICASNELVWMP